MSYTLRNTIVLAIIWALLFIAGGFYIWGVQDKKLDQLITDNKQKQDRIETLEYRRHRRNELEKTYKHLRDISMGKLGTLSNNESPGETFDYMLRELRQTGSGLLINQDYIREETFLSVKRHIYEISGMADFPDIYKLVWFLENGPIFYDIKTLQVDRATPNGNEISQRDCSFTMQLWGFKRDQGGIDIRDVVREKDNPESIHTLVSNSVSQAFDRLNVRLTSSRPGKISEPSTQPAQKPEPSRPRNVNGLPEISPNTRLLAVTSQSVVVRDQTGKMVKLREGDPVFQGMVQNIDVRNGSASFLIQSGGRSQVVTLTANKPVTRQ
jgi:hypothetical protein